MPPEITKSPSQVTLLGLVCRNFILLNVVLSPSFSSSRNRPTSLSLNKDYRDSILNMYHLRPTEYLGWRCLCYHARPGLFGTVGTRQLSGTYCFHSISYTKTQLCDLFRLTQTNAQQHSLHLSQITSASSSTPRAISNTSHPGTALPSPT